MYACICTYTYLNTYKDINIYPCIQTYIYTHTPLILLIFSFFFDFVLLRRSPLVKQREVSRQLQLNRVGNRAEEKAFKLKNSFGNPEDEDLQLAIALSLQSQPNW